MMNLKKQPRQSIQGWYETNFLWKQISQTSMGPINSLLRNLKLNNQFNTCNDIERDQNGIVEKVDEKS